MKHTTHDLSEDQKQKIFYMNFNLIYLLYCLNSMSLRKQLIQLYHLMHNIDSKKVEFMIADLIKKGFILQHKVSNSNTMMLYLSKWPRSQFNQNKDAKDMEVLTFSKNKMYKHIFTVDFIIQTVIPILKLGSSAITAEKLMAYLASVGSNLLLKSSQYDNPDFYQNFERNCSLCSLELTDDFYRDYEISRYDKQNFRISHSRPKQKLIPCEAKLARLADMDKCKTDIERNKQFYSLNNFSANNFVYNGFDPTKKTFYIAYFDHMNTIQTKKLWTNITYIFCMIQRYTNIMDIKLHTDLFVWDECRKKQLEEDFAKQAYDFYNQEWSGQNKVNKIFQDIGILPIYRQNFKLDITVNNIYEKYNINLN